MTSQSPSRKAFFFLGIAASLAAGTSWGDVRLPHLIGDHMVLQRDSKIVIWGWADSGEIVRINFRGRRLAVRTGQDGRWSTSLGLLHAGGPYDMTIAGRNRIVLHDLLIGDVWLASGQSNMEFTLGRGKEDYKIGVISAEREIADSAYPQLRLFQVQHTIAFKPAEDVKTDGWVESAPDSAGKFSAVAYLFGRELHKRYHVPLELIETDWGATVAEAWVSAAGLKSFPEFGTDIEVVYQSDDASAKADHDRYVQLEAAWNAKHSAEDRGMQDSHPLWANSDFDAAAWPIITEPQSKPNERLRGFDGAVWFRREITIPRNLTTQNVIVHLSSAGKADITYFNGREIGHTEGWDQPRTYRVPADAIRTGRNVLVVRMTGDNGYVGMFDSENPDKLYLEIGGKSTPLAGSWSYEPGPDVTDRPVPSALSKLKDNPNKSTVLFNGMIHPLSPFRIKGAIWYQGESNALDHRSVQYRTLFPALIKDWRTRWGYEFPFLFVQLAGFGHNGLATSDDTWSELREAQSMALSLPLTGMATAVDIGDESNIHPRDKQDVAHRLVLAAAKVAYGDNIVSSGPTFRSMEIEGNNVRIHFSNLGSGLRVNDNYGYLRGFQIAGIDGKFVWARAHQEGNDIVVFNDFVPQPTVVRYDWMNTPDGNLYNEEGLPAVPFRADALTSLIGTP